MWKWRKPTKKLTVDKSLFPWIDEPAPVITPVLPVNYFLELLLNGMTAV